MHFSLSLSLLCLWVSTGPVQSVLNVQNLKTITNFIKQHYQVKEMYAMALSIPSKICTATLSSKDLTALLSEDTKTNLDQDMNSNGIYQGRKMIAAKPHYMKNENNENYTEHAELLLLSGAGGETSPLQKLRDSDQNACLYFFVKGSPCTGKCLNDDNRDNIIPFLEVFMKDGKMSDERAFVFYDIFEKDKDKSETVLHEYFKKIFDYVPLYRCIESYGCYDCRTLGSNGCYWRKQGSLVQQH